MSKADGKEEYPEFRWQALSTKRQGEMRVFLGPIYLVDVINGSAPFNVVIEMACNAIDKARSRLITDGPIEWNRWADGQLSLSRSHEQDDSLLEPPELYCARMRVVACGWVNMHLASQDLRDTLLPGIENLPRSLAIMREDKSAERRYKVLRCATELTAEANPDRWKYRARRADTRVPTPLREAIKERTGVACSTSAKDLVDMGWRLPPVLQNTVAKMTRAAVSNSSQ